MAFWGTDRLNDPNSGFSIENSYEGAISQACCRLRLGDEVYVTPLSDSWKSPERKIRTPDDGKTIDIPPGQFAYLLTHEEITIPLNAIGLISMKTEEKFLGLVNVSGFHVDPGHKGKLIFAVWNAGPQPITLRFGKYYFKLWLADVEGPENDWDGVAYDSIPTKYINGAGTRNISLGQLSEDVKKLKTNFRIMSLVAAIAVTAIIVPTIKSLIEQKPPQTVSSSSIAPQSQEPVNDGLSKTNDLKMQTRDRTESDGTPEP